MTRVLLTGANGFIGAQAVPALLGAGYDVCALDRHPPRNPAVRFIEADLLDPRQRWGAVEQAQASHLLHLAWITDPGVYWASPANLDWSVATLDLFSAFRHFNGSRAVFAGSCAEYEWGQPRLHEASTPCRPATVYGIVKDATRRTALAYAQSTGLSAAWARLFYIYGPGEKPGRLVPDAIAALRLGRPFPTTPGLQKRDFLHVADAAAALVALLESPVEGPVNIGSGAATSIRTVLDTLAGLLGNANCIEYGARLLAASEPPVIEADIERLTAEVGFRPVFELASGLADTITRVR